MVRKHSRARKSFSTKLYLEQLEDRTLPAVVMWTNPAGGDWDTPGNWSTGSVPGAADDAVINTSGISVTHSTGASDAINSLDSQAAIALSGGSLSIASASTINNSFTLSGGVLNGTGAITVTGSMTWTGGNMNGTGQTITNGSLAITANSQTLDSLTLTVNGGATLTGG